jgi:protein required for attachment to host cells
MPEYLLRQGIWVAVCDGRRALLLKNNGTREFPKLETRECFEQENPPTHVQGSAPPGRAFSTAGSRRGAVEESDTHDRAERSFLEDFAKCIDKHVRDHDIRSLILVAPARALGMIRPAMSDATRRIVVAELDRDYVKLPLYQIEQHLRR